MQPEDPSSADVCCAGQCFLPGCFFCLFNIIGHVIPPCLCAGACVHMNTRKALKQKYKIEDDDGPDFCIALCCK